MDINVLVREYLLNQLNDLVYAHKERFLYGICDLVRDISMSWLEILICFMLFTITNEFPICYVSV